MIHNTAGCCLERWNGAEEKKNLIRLIAGTGKARAWPDAHSLTIPQTHPLYGEA